MGEIPQDSQLFQDLNLLQNSVEQQVNKVKGEWNKEDPQKRA